MVVDGGGTGDLLGLYFDRKPIPCLYAVGVLDEVGGWDCVWVDLTVGTADVVMALIEASPSVWIDRNQELNSLNDITAPLVSKPSLELFEPWFLKSDWTIQGKSTAYDRNMSDRMADFKKGLFLVF